MFLFSLSQAREMERYYITVYLRSFSFIWTISREFVNNLNLTFKSHLDFNGMQTPMAYLSFLCFFFSTNCIYLIPFFPLRPWDQIVNLLWPILCSCSCTHFILRKEKIWQLSQNYELSRLFWEIKNHKVDRKWQKTYVFKIPVECKQESSIKNH